MLTTHAVHLLVNNGEEGSFDLRCSNHGCGRASVDDVLPVPICRIELKKQTVTLELDSLEGSDGCGICNLETRFSTSRDMGARVY